MGNGIKWRDSDQYRKAGEEFQSSVDGPVVFAGQSGDKVRGYRYGKGGGAKGYLGKIIGIVAPLVSGENRSV